MSDDYQALADKALKMGATGARLIDPEQVVFDPRSHFKCRFGCNRWGQYWTCPPNLDLGQEEFDKAFAKYSKALVIQHTDPKKSQQVTLELEKAAMFDHGSPFALALVLCVLCDPCAHPEPCGFPHLARPSMDAYGIDINGTVEPVGFEVAFDPGGQMLPAWYSMVLLD